MILGAYFLYTGDVLKSIISYVIADSMWMFLSIQVGNYIGAGVVFIALIFIISVWYKMNTGVFHKTIVKTKQRNEHVQHNDHSEEKSSRIS